MERFEEWREQSTIRPQVAAQILGMTKNKVYEGCFDGTIPCFRVGKNIYVKVAGLRSLLGEIQPGDSPPA